MLHKKILRKLNRGITNFGYDTLHLMGINRILKSGSGRRILVYHGLCEHDHLRYNYSFITKHHFEEQIKLYLDHFNIVTLDEFYQNDSKKNKFDVCLTFDDGLANNFYHVLPILERYRVPATFFIPSIRDAGYDFLWNHFLDAVSKFGPPKITFDAQIYHKTSGKYTSVATGLTLNQELRNGNFEMKEMLIRAFRPYFEKAKEDHEYWLQMTNEQIHTLSGYPFVTIGCHGYYHNDLAALSPDSIEMELKANKDHLEKICGKKINALAFPYGSYTAEVVAAAKASGFDKLLALDLLYADDINDNKLQPRLVINPLISSFNQARAVIDGKYA